MKYLIFLLLFFPPCLFALDFSFEAAVGITGGVTKEYVIEGEKTISRLDWNDKVVPVFSFAGQADFFNVFTQIKIDTIIPIQSGTMEDYDFLAAGSTEPSLYSKHDAYLDKDFETSIQAGYTFTFGNLKLRPALAFSYINKKWTAQDGSLQYPLDGGLWTGNEPEQKVSGTVISYEQAIWYPSISLMASYKLNRKLGVSFVSSISPYIWAQTIDTHFMRSLRFYDILGGGFCYGFDVYIDYMFNKQLSFFIDGGYKAITNLNGSTSSSGTGIDDGTLIIEEGYNSEMENNRVYFMIGVKIQLNN